MKQQVKEVSKDEAKRLLGFWKAQLYKKTSDSVIYTCSGFWVRVGQGKTKDQVKLTIIQGKCDC